MVTVFGPTRDEVNRGLEETAYQEVHDMNFSPNIIW
jgi:hypothetical protein